MVILLRARTLVSQAMAGLVALGLAASVAAKHDDSAHDGTHVGTQAGAKTGEATVVRGSLIASPIGTEAMPIEPWRLALLPRQTKPVTDFSVVELDGERVLRVSASKSYGKLLHPVPESAERPRYLHWHWRIDRAPEAADLRSRGGDDVALRVCAFFDWPHERLPLLDRTRLLAAEMLAGEALPTAALCYVWDAALPAGTVMPNAFTRRLRMMIVDGDGGSAVREWRVHARDLAKDFRTAFADEWQDGDTMPPLRAVVIGADTDNTGSDGLAYVKAIALKP